VSDAEKKDEIDINKFGHNMSNGFSVSCMMNKDYSYDSQRIGGIIKGITENSKNA
jgi:hypothetical protein